LETGTLLRFIAGDATPEEIRRVETWAAAADDHARELRVLAAAWRQAVTGTGAAAAPADPGAAPDSAVWRRIAARLDESAAARNTSATDRAAAPTRRVYMPRRALLRAAAIALLLAGAAVFALIRSADAPGQAVWTTAAGETRDIVLPDSSRVRLGPSSTLRTAADFSGAERRVLLRGSAHFDVRRAEPRRFVVAAGRVETTVLGTEFMVRAYDDEPVDVAVVQGLVSVSSPGSAAARVQAGERALVQDGSVRVRREDLRPLLGLRDGRLIFRDAELPEAARELERWYGVAVEITDARLAQRRVTLSLPAAPLDEVLELLQASLNVRIEQRGRTVFIGGAP
jgi:ferric-dicitrate binding protein FerR (iron transport regulator)